MNPTGTWEETSTSVPGLTASAAAFNESWTKSTLATRDHVPSASFTADCSEAVSAAVLTAWNMLHTLAKLQPGETLLVMGAASGVGVAAIQIAKLAQARIIAVAGSTEKLAKAKTLGADYGINYKDKGDAALSWIAALGNPYTRIGADDGRVGIDWGVYGVPETFVVDRAGRIRYKHVGPLTQADLDRTILPLVAQLEK